MAGTFNISVETDKGRRVGAVSVVVDGGFSYNGLMFPPVSTEDEDFVVLSIGQDIVSRSLETDEYYDDDDIALIVKLQSTTEDVILTILKTAVDPTPDDLKACIQNFMRFARLTSLVV